MKRQLGNMTKKSRIQSLVRGLRINDGGGGGVAPFISTFPVETLFFTLFSHFPR